MEVILLADVKSLGKKGDRVTVSDGYARNFLLKRKLGVEATAGNLNDLKLKNANDARVEAAKVADAKRLSEELKDKSVTLSIRAGEGGKLFGSVSAKEIAEAAKTQLGIEIDRKKMVLAEPIRALGTYEVPVKLYRDVNAVLIVRVVQQ